MPALLFENGGNMDRQDCRKDIEAEETHRCILCEAAIEIDEYDIYFTTGHCRFCQAVLEEEE